MKKTITLKHYLVLACALLLGLASCKKDIEHGVVVGSKGTPTISSVRTLGRSVNLPTDSVKYHYITAKGKDSVVTFSNEAPVVTPLDSMTVTGKIGSYYVAKGDHLGSVTKITLNGVNVLFNKALGTDNSVVFSIPSNVPVLQPQPNELAITTLYGTATFKFTTLPPAPTITGVTEYNFTAGTKIIAKGIGFKNLKGIKLNSIDSAVVNYVAQGDSILTLTMPATTATQATLSFAYTSDAAVGQTLHTGSSVSFVSIDNNYLFFANGAIQNGWYDASWAHPSGPTATGPSMQSGKGSYLLNFPAGGWQLEGFGNNTGINYSADYKFLTFWIKGGTADHTLVLVGNTLVGGDNQVQNANAYAGQLVKVPANVWTYYKIPLTNSATAKATTALNLWETPANTALKGLRFFLQGQSGDVNESIYVDEMMLVK
jgi:hypothetical protein